MTDAPPFQEMVHIFEITSYLTYNSQPWHHGKIDDTLLINTYIYHEILTSKLDLASYFRCLKNSSVFLDRECNKYYANYQLFLNLKK